MNALLACLLLLPAAAPQEPPASATTTISGRVVDMRGYGVPVARVWIGDGDGPADDAPRAVADGEGYFRLSKVPAGRHWVRATSDGHAVGSDLSSGGSDYAIVRVHDATTVRGVLRDADGEPVAGVTVAASPTGRAFGIRQITATTDDEGRFAIDKVPLARVLVSAWVPDEGLATARVTAVDGTELTLRPVAEDTTSIALAIDGLPAQDAPDVTLSFLPYRNHHLTTLPPPYRLPVVVGGRWSAEGIPDWEYRITPRAQGWAFEPNSVRLQPQKGPHQVAFVATRLGAETLRCPARVTGPDGEPVAGVTFVLRRAAGGPRAQATSDADGALTFDSPLAAGTKVVVYSITDAWVCDQPKTDELYGSWDRRYLEDHEWVVAPDRTLELRVAPACEVSGALRLADGRPAAFTRVELQERRANRQPEWMAFAWATTGRDGGFRVRRQHDSPDEVRAVVNGVAGHGISESFTLDRAGTRVELQTLTLTPPAVVEGVVRDAQGEPLPGMGVWLRHPGDGSVTEVVTDRQGRYRFPAVPLRATFLVLVPDEETLPTGQACDVFETEAGQVYTRDLTAQ